MGADLAVPQRAAVWRPANYTFYSPPVVSTTRRAAGRRRRHRRGGARSSLTPAAEGSRCDIVCRFGELLVPGSADDASGAITCVSPANAAAAGHALSFYVSLNRQDFSAGSHTFRYVEGGTASSPIGISSVLPASGPLAGGTFVTVAASHLSGGDDYTCRWLRNGGSAHVVNATYSSASDRVTCVSPPSPPPLPTTFRSRSTGSSTASRSPLARTATRCCSPPLARPRTGRGARRWSSRCPPVGGRQLHMPMGDAGGMLPSSPRHATIRRAGEIERVLPPAVAQGMVRLRVAQRAAVRRVSLAFDVPPTPSFAITPSSGPWWAHRGSMSAAAPPRRLVRVPANDGIVMGLGSARRNCSDAAHNGTLCGLRPGTDRRFATPTPPDGSSSLAHPRGGLVPALSSSAGPGGPEPSSSRRRLLAVAAACCSVSPGLNGQQYRRDRHALPPPVVGRASSGPAAGGTVVVGGSILRAVTTTDAT